jgi:pyridoxal phosphate enzyme (YggS family)
MLTAPQNPGAGLASVRHRIQQAALAAGRDPAAITLVAVSKGQPAAQLRAAIRAGQADFGENYLQEAAGKLAELAGEQACWHFIGSLQANKTREVAALFDWVHTVDRERIARRLNDQRSPHAAPLQVCLQVRLGDEPTKSGVDPAELASLATAVASMPRLRLRGLMCLPPEETAPERQRGWFRQLAGLRDALNASGHQLDVLSMGMSNDLEQAIAEGATHVRVGTAVFGARPGGTEHASTT